ncbi:MAG TPA: hypothetical protein PKL77_10850 [Candidatus Omnitrophota bacterium]|nr:hypothetical protein [Candidatus Omnitrophota bacterium]
MTTGEIISLCAVVLAVVTLLLTSLRDSRARRRENVGDAEDSAQTISDIKADTRYTARKVAEISDDVKTLRGELSDVSRRVTVCEESEKSAHKRIDGHDQRLLAIERRVGGE